MEKSIFSTPKLVKAKQGWYVYFRYAGVLKRYKFKLNYIKDLKIREREFNMLRKALHKKLKEGWNPLLPDVVEEQEQMYLIDALNFALEQKKSSIAPKSYSGYKGSVKFYTEAITSLHLNYLTITETKRVHIRKIAEKAKMINKWSNKAYNKHLNHIRAVISELIQWDIIETNPAHNIKNLPVEETRANITATPEQHKQIKECLENDHPHFYIYIATIFHTGIRPKEILDIKLNMIDMKNQQIILPPEITKTNKERIVPINNHLLMMLMNLDLEIYPNDFYLFGSYREPGKGNRGKFIDFIPGPTRLKRDTATKRWKRIIKDGLGINVNMYSNKHAGANAKILAGMDLDVLRELYGHTSKLMTLRYAKAVKEVYRKQIIERSPEF